MELLPSRWNGKHPRYQALAEVLRDAVTSGELPAGTRLPAERRLATALGVSRSTVVSAYDLLREDGLLLSRTGSGTFVPPRIERGARTLRLRDMVDGRSRLWTGRHEGAEMINLSIARPRTIDGLLEEAIAASAEAVGPLAEQIEYATQGLPELRHAVAEQFTRRGLPTSARQVLITTGAQQAIGLIVNLYVSLGDGVLLETPTYLGAIEALRARNAGLIALPAGERPCDPEHIERLARRVQPVLAFLMPTCHTITGAVTPPHEREELARLSEELQLPLIEDDIFAGLTFRPDEAPPVAAYAEDAPIFTIGSTSKLLWNGLRIGWLRAPEALVTRLARSKGTLDLGTSMIAQLVALHLLDRADEIARQRLEEMAERLALATDLLEAILPDWRWRTPDGGRSLWLRLPVGDATELLQVASRNGVLVVAGPTLSPDGGNADHLRLMYVQQPEVLTVGVQRLGLAWADYLQRFGRDLLPQGGRGLALQRV